METAIAATIVAMLAAVPSRAKTTRYYGPTGRELGRSR